MSSEYRPIPFRWILPMAQLLLCAAILWPVRQEVVHQVRSSIRHYRSNGQTYDGPVYRIDLKQLPPDEQETIRILSLEAPPIRFEPDVLSPVWGPILLNLPTMMVDLPYTILVSSEKMAWVPKGMDFRYWRAISWPFVGLFFWWVAGRGIEAIRVAFRGLIRPNVTYAEVAVGLLVAGWGVVFLLIPFCLGDAYTDIHFLHALSAAGAAWFLLGGTTIVARIMQWRIRRRSASPAREEPSPA